MNEEGTNHIPTFYSVLVASQMTDFKMRTKLVPMPSTGKFLNGLVCVMFLDKGQEWSHHAGFSGGDCRGRLCWASVWASELYLGQGQSSNRRLLKCMCVYVGWCSIEQDGELSFEIVFSCLLVDFKPVGADLTSSELVGPTGPTFSGTALT